VHFISPWNLRGQCTVDADMLAVAEAMSIFRSEIPTVMFSASKCDQICYNKIRATRSKE
jgi:hypothetical protein